jgi:hypothetical protein
MMRLEDHVIDFNINMDYGLYGIGFLQKILLPKLLKTFGSINVAAKIKL